MSRREDVKVGRISRREDVKAGGSMNTPIRMNGKL